MADETGLDVPNGHFARKTVGRAVNRLLRYVGANGRRYPPQAAPPTNPEVGDTYLADGDAADGWDPADTGNPAFVQFDGEAWTVIVEHE